MFGMTLAACMLATGVGTMDLDFPGGTAAEWTTAIRVASPDANIVISDGVRDVLVSAMKFEGVSLSSVMQSCEPASGSKLFGYEIHGDGDSVWAVIAASPRAKRSRNSHTTTDSPVVTKNTVNVHILPHGYRTDVGAARVAEILKAINNMQHDQPLGVLLIEGGQIIALHGSYDQLGVAAAVIDSLNEAPARSGVGAIPAATVGACRMSSRQALIVAANAREGCEPSDRACRENSNRAFFAAMKDLRACSTSSDHGGVQSP
ncbi:MAG: hypothetical protein P8I91_01885 [Phycisphaerales bacterium]|nr:hypothetical protein [Phycisphaerales bacterium]